MIGFLKIFFGDFIREKKLLALPIALEQCVKT